MADSYETGVVLKKLGIIPGYNLTLECAVCKLCYLFGKGLSITEIKQKMVISLKGELNKPIDWLGQNFLLIKKQCEIEESLPPLSPEQIIYYCSKGELFQLKEQKINPEDLSRGGYDGRTPLHLASANGHLSVLKYLVSKKVIEDINPVDRWGGTPYDDALREQNDEVADYLQSVGGISGSEKKRKSRLHQKRWIEECKQSDEELFLKAKTFLDDTEFMLFIIGPGMISKKVRAKSRQLDYFARGKGSYLPRYGETKQKQYWKIFLMK